MSQDMFIASFPSVEKARTAVASNSCQMNWSPACESMPFSLGAYGTNYLTVDDIVRQLRPVILTLLIIAFTIATIIIWAMMGGSWPTRGERRPFSGRSVPSGRTSPRSTSPIRSGWPCGS